MKKETKAQLIYIFGMIVIYLINIYLPLGFFLSLSLILGIMFFGITVYMKIKGTISKFTVFIFIILGIEGVLVFLEENSHIITYDYDYYETLIPIVICILMDILVIAGFINKYKYGTTQEFIKFRNMAVLSMIGIQFFLATCIYSLIKQL